MASPSKQLITKRKNFSGTPSTMGPEETFKFFKQESSNPQHTGQAIPESHDQREPDEKEG